MQLADGGLEIPGSVGTFVQLVDELWHGAGDGADGLSGQRLKGCADVRLVARLGHGLHVGQARDGLVPRNCLRMQRLIGALQLRGLRGGSIGCLAHDGDGLFHARCDLAVAVHDAGVDFREHGKESVHELLGLGMDFGLGAVWDEGPCPVVGVLVQALAVRIEQLIPQDGGVERRHVPLGLGQRVLQLRRLEEVCPWVGGPGDALLPVLGQHTGCGVHVIDDPGIGIVQPFQQLFADLHDGGLIGNAIGVRNLLRRVHDGVVQVDELTFALADLGEHRGEAVGLLLRDCQILVDCRGIQGGDGLCGFLHLLSGFLQPFEGHFRQEWDIILHGFSQPVIGGYEFVDEGDQLVHLLDGFR